MASDSPAIRFHDVTKVFRRPNGRGDLVAMDRLSFEIAPGEIVAVLGKTGCGKSTMFNLIAGACAGEPEIFVCDEPFSALDEMTARDLRAEFLRLVRQNGKTAVFVTHLINEAMEVGDRILVFHRPARIALEIGGGRAADEA